MSSAFVRPLTRRDAFDLMIGVVCSVVVPIWFVARDRAAWDWVDMLAAAIAVGYSVFVIARISGAAVASRRVSQAVSPPRR